MKYPYPDPPQHVSSSVRQPSSSFLAQIKRVVAALVVFGIVYVLLLALIVVLALAMGAVAFALIAELAGAMGIMLGLALLAAGVLLVYFMVKFLFVKKEADRTGFVEIYQHEQPELFDFIKRISEEVGTSFPMHVYLSADVNAAVFYDSTVKSMFFNVPKNLVIGMGLVNSLNLSEFKAVLAHEFGHFSQESMRAGSYVYQVNKAMFNMLFENDGFDKVLTRVAKMNYVFGLVALMVSKIIRFIQWVQRQCYKYVNMAYSRLSREMEFHADAVAVSVSGSSNGVSALKRLDFGSNAYTMTLNVYNKWLGEGIIAQNIYPDHRVAMRELARSYRVQVVDGLPAVTGNELTVADEQRVQIEDVWASHPTQEQREERMNALQVEAPATTVSAWSLFRNVTALQEQMTAQIYTDTQKADKPFPASVDKFAVDMEQTYFTYRLPEVYGDMFRQRALSRFDTASVMPVRLTDARTFFRNASKLALINDIATLDAVIASPQQFKAFSYRGEKYEQVYAKTIKDNLDKELAETRELLAKADTALLAHALYARSDAEPLRKQFAAIMTLADLSYDSSDLANEMEVAFQTVLATNPIADPAKKARVSLIGSTRKLLALIERCTATAADPTVFTSQALFTITEQDSTSLHTIAHSSDLSNDDLNTVYTVANSYWQWMWNVMMSRQQELLVGLSPLFERTENEEV